jgi:hypothetical protein
MASSLAQAGARRLRTRAPNTSRSSSTIPASRPRSTSPWSRATTASTSSSGHVDRPRRLASSEAAYLSSLEIMRSATARNAAEILSPGKETLHNTSLRIIRFAREEPVAIPSRVPFKPRPGAVPPPHGFWFHRVVGCEMLSAELLPNRLDGGIFESRSKGKGVPAS